MLGYGLSNILIFNILIFRSSLNLLCSR